MSKCHQQKGCALSLCIWKAYLVLSCKTWTNVKNRLLVLHFRRFLKIRIFLSTGIVCTNDIIYLEILSGTYPWENVPYFCFLIKILILTNGKNRTPLLITLGPGTTEFLVIFRNGYLQAESPVWGKRNSEQKDLLYL